MNNLLRLLQRLAPVLLFAVLLAVGLSLYVSTTFYQKARFSHWAVSMLGHLNARYSNIEEYVRLSEVNHSLHRENIALKNELERYRLAMAEANIFLAPSDSTAADVYTYLPARVISNSVGTQHNRMLLDIGAARGVERGMGVVCANGVVGIVTAVSQNFASVISLLNTDIRVSALHAPSGTFGLLQWDGADPRQVQLVDIPPHVQVAEGDSIVTSGYSALFPRGVPIGRVLRYQTEAGRSYSLDVALFADFQQLLYVYVVRTPHAAERLDIEQQPDQANENPA